MFRAARAIACIAPAALAACSVLIDTTGFSSGTVSSDASPGTDALADRGDDALLDAAPVEPAMVAAGGHETCAARGASTFCWGSNGRGQVGDGTTVTRGVPTPVLGLPAARVTALAVGTSHACAVAGGEAWCWGSGLSGELGDGKKTDSSTAVKVSVLPTGKVTDVCAGAEFSCAVADTIASCWGHNGAGRLGIGTSVASAPTPATVVSGTAPLTGVTRVSCGQDHACARKANGEVHCWGHNDNGALGTTAVAINDFSTKALPVVGLPAPAELAHIAGWHGCALAGGAMSCWGTGTAGELGNGGNVNNVSPVPVVGLGGVTTFALGGGPDDGDATCAITGGEVSCWGNGQRGRLGDGLTTSRNTPAKVNGIGGATSVAGGYDHFCAALSGGELRCWGRGVEGQLGDGAGVDRFAAVSVTLPP